MVRPEFTQNTVNIWFPNQKEPIYDSSRPDSITKFNEYWNKEKDRMINGFDIGGIHISGWLYWHTVYWKIMMYLEIGQGKSARKIKKIVTPFLRDIEWMVDTDFRLCLENGKFYMLVGARDFGKSVMAASKIGLLYTMFPNSQSVVSSGAKGYIKMVTDKIEEGLTFLHPVLKKKRLLNNWKEEVKAGWKDKQTLEIDPRSSLSTIIIRNYDEGNNTMAANGTRPGFHLIDEVGTFANVVSCLKDSEPCWWSGKDEDPSKIKPSCLVMLAGTGGDMEVGADAADIFHNPEGYNMLSFHDEWEGGADICRFVPGTLAKMSYKEEKTLAEYLKIDHPALKKIKILVSNQEKYKSEWWDVEYSKVLKTGNQKALLKFKAYSPLKPSDSFLILTTNHFNVIAVQAQQARLKETGMTGTPVILDHDGQKVVHKFTDKRPISKFPAKDEPLDAPVVIWEFPVDENPPFGLYTAGVDPYRFDRSANSNSLGVVYIFKRIHNIQSEKFQNMFVACYAARPDSKDTWNKTAKLLIQYYNAYTLCENDEYGFIDYMIKEGCASRYLCPQPEWLREIVPKTSVNRDYGIHRSSEKVRNHLDWLLKKYLDEVIYSEKDIDGNAINEILQVTKVPDPVLLEEIVKFNADGNFDRVVAAELAVALADHLNPQFKVGDLDEDPRLKAYFSRKHTPSTPLPAARKTFGRTGRAKLFT